MSMSAAPTPQRYAPSNQIDCIVLAMVAFVCFVGMRLSAPEPADNTPLPDGSVPETARTLDAGIVPDIAPALPAIDPPADIPTPSVKPDTPPEPAALWAITPRRLAELTPSEHIASAAGFISLMGTNYDPTNWHRSTHAASTDFLATDWAEDKASYNADGLSLKLERSPDRPEHFLGGEIQTKQSYGYGRYEVLMRPAKAAGTVSSFFTYTGPYYGNPHDEVDIEFLGADTTKIYLNYFRNGRVGEDQTIDLPFDAGENLHLYAFEWHRDGITWFVDGVPIHQTRPEDPLIPQTPGAIFVNLWSGKPRLYSWHGQPDFSETQADYACISFRPLGSTSRSCSSIFPPEPPAITGRPGLLMRALGELVGKVTLSGEARTQIN